LKEGEANLVGERGARPFRVLSLDGGGMRGVYTSTYLGELADAFARKRRVPALDVGNRFDLIVGTSTGAIVACALAAAVPLREVVSLPAHAGLQARGLWSGLLCGPPGGTKDPVIAHCRVEWCDEDTTKPRVWNVFALSRGIGVCSGPG
jgi:Patatin-like phospholipase